MSAALLVCFSAVLRCLRAIVLGAALSAAPLFAAEEACTVCRGTVTVTGEFAHAKEPPGTPLSDSAAFREDIHGPRFLVTVAHLPAGRYTIEISAVETSAQAASERVFDVLAGEQVLAQDFDLFVVAGGRGKPAVITAAIEKSDDALRGPL